MAWDATGPWGIRPTSAIARCLSGLRSWIAREHVVEVRELDHVTVDVVQQRDDPHLLQEFEGALVCAARRHGAPPEASTAHGTRIRIHARYHVDMMDRPEMSPDGNRR